MKFSTWAMTLLGGLAVVCAGLGLALRYDLEWLRVTTFAIACLGAGSVVMIAKKRRQRRDRSMAEDSVELVLDRNARASAFVVAIVATAIATAVATVAEFPAWVLGFLLLLIFAVSYWVARAAGGLGATDARDE